MKFYKAIIMDITGKYKTQHGEVTISQKGETLSATYGENGTCNGIIKNNIVEGSWHNSGGEGLFKWVFEENGKFTGKYKKGLDVGAMRGSWDGEKINLENKSSESNNNESKIDHKEFDFISFYNKNAQYFNLEPTVNLLGKIDSLSSIRSPLTVHYWNGVKWKKNDGFTDPGIKGPRDIYLGLVYKFTSGALSNTWSGNSYGYMFKDMLCLANTIYTLSNYIYVSEDCSIDSLNLSTENASNNNIEIKGLSGLYNLDKKGSWQRLARSSSRTEKGNIRFIPIYPSKNGVTNGSFDGFFMFGGAMIEEKSLPSVHYTDGHLPKSVIDCNFKSILLNSIKKGDKETFDTLSEIVEDNDLILFSSIDFTKVYLDYATILQSNKNSFEKQQVNYKSGDSYFGFIKLKLRNGKGKYNFADGRIYEGDFLDDKFHGKGKFTWLDGDFYEGDFVDGKRTGKGKFTWPDGEIYEGDFVDGKYHGKGKLKFASGRIYEGDFVDGKRTGKGKITWPNGEIYEGDFVDGKRTGKGKHKFASGSIYEGDWKDEKRHGKGKQTWLGGDFYEGEWKDDKRLGKTKDEMKNDTFKPETPGLLRSEDKTNSTFNFNIKYSVKLKEDPGFFNTFNAQMNKAKSGGGFMDLLNVGDNKGGYREKVIRVTHSKNSLSLGDAKKYVIKNDYDVIKGVAGTSTIEIISIKLEN
jgi:hypothetical protein